MLYVFDAWKLNYWKFDTNMGIQVDRWWFYPTHWFERTRILPKSPEELPIKIMKNVITPDKPLEERLLGAGKIGTLVINHEQKNSPIKIHGVWKPDKKREELERLRSRRPQVDNE